MGRAIVRQPQVFLFDEPLSNLDAKLRAQTRLEIQKLHRELGITSLFVTHDQVEAMTLAQRMIVMNAGRMEQFGTPEEVYQRPASTFVAGFIGSPPMNLLRGQADGARFTIGGQTLPLPAAAPRNGELILGLRPEHASWGADGGGTWALQVEVVEMLGAERLVYCRLGETLFTRAHRRHAARRRAPATACRWACAAERLHWFDAGTGQRDAHERATLALPAAGSPTAAPASWRRRTRWPPSASARTTATGPSNATSSSAPTACLSCCTTPRWSAPPPASGMAGERTWAELSQLDAGSWHSRLYAGEPLPSLKAVAAFVQRNGFALDLEIKPTPGLEAHTGAVVAGEVARLWHGQPHGAAAQLLPARGAARRARLRARTAARAAARHLARRRRRQGLALRCVAVITHHKLMDAALVARIHAAGMRAMVYTVNEAERARQLLACRIDGLVTDAVDRFSPCHNTA